MKAEKEAEEEAAAAESVADGRMSLRPLELWRGLWRLARSSRFLRLLCVGDGLVVGGLVGLFSVLNSFVMSYYGWRQGDLEAVLLATLAPLCTLLFVASARLRLIDRLGAAATECARRPPPAARRPPPSFPLPPTPHAPPSCIPRAHATPCGDRYAATAVALVGWLLLCLAPLHAGFLGGAALLAPAVVSGPATLTLLAGRFGRTQLAQAQSLISTSVSVGFIVALPAFALLFDAAAPRLSLRASLPFAASAALVAAGSAVKMYALCPDGSACRALLAAATGRGEVGAAERCCVTVDGEAKTKTKPGATTTRSQRTTHAML